MSEGEAAANSRRQQLLACLRPHALFLAPAGLFILLSFLYLLAIPAGESPDEPGHLQCIEQAAVGRRPPRLVHGLPDAGEWWSRENLMSDYMCYHMPAYYLGAGFLMRWVSPWFDLPLTYDFPAGNQRFGEEAAIFRHEPRHSFWQLDQPANLVLLRLLSISAGLVVLACTYLIAFRVSGENQVVALVAATIVAGWPQFIFIHRAISNDPAATALAAAVLATLMFIGEPRRFVAAGILAALALLTKLTVAFTLPLVLLVWFMEFRFYPEKRPAYVRVVAFCLIIWTGVLALLWLQPALRSNLQYLFGEVAGVHPGAYLPAYWQQVYVWTLSSGWAWFGWLNVSVPVWHAQLWWFGVQLTVLLGTYAAVKRATSFRRRLQLLLLAIWCLAILLLYIRVTATVWQPQFRFAFSALPALASLMAYGLLFRLEQSSRGAWLLWGLLFLALLGYNVWLVFFRLLPAYL
jgi:hypothetical protein